MGKGIERHLSSLAELRISVFKEYPYLYDGTVEYEMKYLSRYVECKKSIAVLIKDHEKIVGASTAMPLAEEHDEFIASFRQSGIDINDVYYLAESVLLPEYRGMGFGQRFFDFRESHASVLHYPITAFCAIERDPSDPRRPKDYRPLDDFWKSRGYRKSPLSTTFSWKELNETSESPKKMVFWLKSSVRDA